MKRIRSLVVLIIAAIFLFCGTVFTASAEEADYSQAAKLINVMQIKLPDSQGNPSLDTPIEKYQAALLVAQTMTGKTDLDFWNMVPESEVFSDVYSYGGAIDYLYKSGIVDGKSEAVFGYSEDVSYAEMLSYCVSALGYETADFVYPYDHIIAAERLGLGDSITATDYSHKVNYGEVAQLLWNMLCTEMAINDPITGKILYPGERSPYVDELERFTLLEETGLFFGKIIAKIIGFIPADAGSYDIAVVECDNGMMEIRASDLGITADTPVKDYLGLDAEIYFHSFGDDFYQESYDNGDVAIVLAEFPEYVTVRNTGIGDEIKYIPEEECFVFGEDKFSMYENEFCLFGFGENGWEMYSGEVLEQFAYSFLHDGSEYCGEGNSYGEVSYRVIEKDYDKCTVEILYTPYEFGQYITRDLVYNVTGEEETFTIIGRYDNGNSLENIDEEVVYFREYFVGSDAPVVSKTVSKRNGEASVAVTVEGAEIESGDFMFYEYNPVDNILTVAKNCGRLETGRLTAYSVNRETVKISGVNYEFGFNGLYPAMTQFDTDLCQCIIDNYVPGEDNVQFLAVDDKIVWMEVYVRAAQVVSLDYVILSTDAELMAELLGMTESQYANSLVGGYYIADGYIKAAELDLESGKWKLANVGGVAVSYDFEEEEFTDIANMPTLLKYAEIATLAPEKAAQLDAAKAVFESAPVYTVADYTDGVYTIAHIDIQDSDGNYLIDRVENAEGLIFSVGGITNAITASYDEEPANISTNENTVYVIIGTTVEVAKGVLSPKKDINGTVTYFAAGEELIVGITDAEIWGWGEPYEIVQGETPDIPTTRPNGFDLAVLSTDPEIMADLLGISDSRYADALIGGYYIEDKVIKVASLDLTSGKWSLASVGGVATAYDTLEEEFNDIVDMATLLKYADIATLAPEKAEQLDAAESVFATGPLYAASVDADGVYTVADINVTDAYGDYVFTRAENSSGLIFDATGKTNAITASSAAAASVMTNANTVIVGVGEGGVGVRRGVQDSRATVYGKVIYFAAGSDLILFVPAFDPSVWGDVYDVAVPETPDEPPYNSSDYGFAIISFDAELMADLLGMTYSRYENALVGGYYLDDGYVIAAGLDVATGKWALVKIEGVATAYDTEEEEFIDIVDVATLVKYADIATLAPAKEQELENAKAVLATGPIYATVAADSDVLTLADIDTENGDGDKLIERVENVDGLIFDDSGKTNLITASPNEEATRIAVNANTVTVAVTPSGIFARRGVQSPKKNIEAAVTYYAASESLIVFSTDEYVADSWGAPEETAEETYYIVMPGFSIELGINDSTDGFFLSVSGLLDLKSFAEVDDIVIVSEDMGELRYIADSIAVGSLLYMDAEGEISMTDDTYAEACMYVHGEEYSEVAVIEWANKNSIVLDGIDYIPSVIDRINTKLVTVDLTEFNWEHVEDLDTFIGAVDYDFGKEYGLPEITVNGGNSRYSYEITVDGIVNELSEPEVGLFSQAEIDLLSNNVYWFIDEEISGELLYSVDFSSIARYDEESGSLDLIVIRTIYSEDWYCSDGAWVPDGNATHKRTCSCGAVETAAHTFSEWETTVCATVTSEGTKVRYCTECNYKQKEAIPSLSAALISLDSVTARAGGTAEVDVVIRNDIGFGGLEFTLSFDTSLLTVESVEFAGGFDGFTCTPVEEANESGEIVFCYADAANNYSEGRIATLKFSTDAAASGAAAAIDVYANNDASFVYDGQIMKDIELVTGGGTVNIYDYIPGDVNRDDSISIRDAAMIMQYIARWSVTIDSLAADVNCDGSINVRDAAMIMQYLAGWDVVLGEAPVSAISLFRVRSASSATVELSKASGGAGETVSVDVMIKDNEGIGGIDFDVVFDRSALELISVSTEGAFASFTVTPVGNANKDGRVSFCYTSLENLLGDGKVATLTFRIARTAKIGDISLSVECGEDPFVYVGEGMQDMAVTALGSTVTVTSEAEAIEGDVDSDGFVTVRDVLLAIDVLLNKKSAGGADVSGDNTVTLVDIIRILKIAVK